jgi:SAM-dependent methyltransferase
MMSPRSDPRPHERIPGLYEENAAAWDRQRGRDLHEAPWLERFSALIPAGGSLLDIGCGMAEPIARWFVDRGLRVTGVDTSPSLIALARGRFPQQEWLVADMRSLDLGRRFDGLIAWHSLIHMTPEDQRAMFARFAAHAVSRAPLMFTSGYKHGESIGQWQSEPLYHGSLDPGDYKTLLAENGFGVVAHKLCDPDCGSATIWLAVRS